MEEKVSIGCINLSGKVVVSDPCYGRGTWRMVKDVSLKPGKYIAYITKKDKGEHGIKVASIMVVHMEHIQTLKANWKRYGRSVMVDSGQCGIFDNAKYPKSRKKYHEEQPFYRECCKLTHGDTQGGILSGTLNGKICKGAVSSSGLGDGYYELFCQYHNGEHIALMVDFGVAKDDQSLNKL